MGPERNKHGKAHSWLKYRQINQRHRGNKGRQLISLKIAAEPPQDGEVLVWGSPLIILLLFLPSWARGGCQPGGRWCWCAPCLGSGFSHPCRCRGRVRCCAVLGRSVLVQPGCGALSSTSPRAVAWREPGRIVPMCFHAPRPGAALSSAAHRCCTRGSWLCFLPRCAAMGSPRCAASTCVLCHRPGEPGELPVARCSVLSWPVAPRRCWHRLLPALPWLRGTRAARCPLPSRAVLSLALCHQALLRPLKKHPHINITFIAHSAGFFFIEKGINT